MIVGIGRYFQFEFMVLVGWIPGSQSFDYVELDVGQEPISRCGYNCKAYCKSAEALKMVLADNDYLINDRFSVTDIIVGWTCHFTTGLGYNDGFDNINAYVARLMQRPKCRLPAFEAVA